MKSKLKPLKVTAKADGGVHDVSVNHDRYLAEFTYARKLGPNATLPAPSPRFRAKSTRPAATSGAGSSACANCGTTRRALMARRLCGRCYHVQLKLDEADEQVAQGFLTGYKKECPRRLNNLRILEEKRNGPISGLDVEHQVIWLAGKAGVKRNKLHLFRGIATLLNDHFQPEQKRLLFCLLSDIEENTPWPGIDWHWVVSG